MVFEWQQISSSLPDSSQQCEQCCSVDGLHSPLTSKSSSPFDSSLVTVQNASISIGIIFTLMFHIFLIPKKYLFFF